MALEQSSRLKQRLLEQSSSLKQKLLLAFSPGGGDSSDKSTEHGTQQHRRKLSEADVVRRWQAEPADSGWSQSLRRKFLIRLATSLHSYGSSASRTEYLMEKASNRLDVELEIAVFPSLILLSFINDAHSLRPAEVHLLRVEIGHDADKLGRADQLANKVGLPDTPVFLAYWRLKAIASAQPEFGRIYWRLLGFSVASGCAALLLFDGSLLDGLLALCLGFVVGLLDSLQCRSSLFTNIFKFIASVVVSFLARLLTIYFTTYRVCYYAVALGSLCRVLPGLTLTLGVSDMVASAQVTGASRIMSALFSSLQIGFGLAIGDDLIFWSEKQAEMSCEPSPISIFWRLVWFLGYALSLNILLHSRLQQWTGMTVAAFVGWIAKDFASLRLGNSAATIVASFAIGVTGTTYSYFTGDLPLVMLFSGILLLVPGGIGIKGVVGLLENDVIAGMGFVFDMTMVALAITMGLLLSKLVLPTGCLVPVKQPSVNVLNVQEQFSDDTDSDVEEDMAI